MSVCGSDVCATTLTAPSVRGRGGCWMPSKLECLRPVGERAVSAVHGAAPGSVPVTPQMRGHVHPPGGLPDAWLLLGTRELPRFPGHTPHGPAEPSQGYGLEMLANVRPETDRKLSPTVNRADANRQHDRTLSHAHREADVGNRVTRAGGHVHKPLACCRGGQRGTSSASRKPTSRTAQQLPSESLPRRTRRRDLSESEHVPAHSCVTRDGPKAGTTQMCVRP